MDPEPILIDILVVLVAAKLAAELAQRVGMSTVVSEIAAGLLIGPSVLSLVDHNDIIGVLAELGVILLLVEVGMQLDIADLRSVGPRAMAVAVVGVVVPFAGGYLAATAFGMPGSAAVFVGAALTATSVGITARAFADLRMLHSPEGRTVMGAAVVDDVIGLVILTIVLGHTTGDSLSTPALLRVLALAVGTLMVLGVAGAWLAPRLLDATRRLARSAGTFTAVVITFVLLYGVIAHAAGLAPMIGAFVAGMCLGRTLHTHQIRRELAPIGHLFIPVFFLQIGIEVQVAEFLDPAVLGITGVLVVVAVLGKVMAGLGMVRSGVDKLMVGLGMVPRGEVGLIFAAVGLRAGVLGPREYGVLILTVLLTTLVAPAALRRRSRAFGRHSGEPLQPTAAGAQVRDQGGTIELEGRPSAAHALEVVFEAARALRAGGDPGPHLLQWLEGLPELPLRWDPRATEMFLELLRDGDTRSWSFLASTGVLERVVPEMADLMQRRSNDLSVPDPLHPFRWDLVTGLNRLGDAGSGLVAERALLKHPERLLLAALVIDMTGGLYSVVTARRLAKRLGLGAAAEEQIAILVGNAELLRAAARRPNLDAEDHVLQLAGHLRNAETARSLYLISACDASMPMWERERLDHLHYLLQETFLHPDLSGREAGNLAERRRTRALAIVGTDSAAGAILRSAPRRILLSAGVQELAVKAELMGRGYRRPTFTIVQDPNGAGYRVAVVAPDRIGLLAVTTTTLARHLLDPIRTIAVTWPDGRATQLFDVGPAATVSAEDLSATFADIERSNLVTPPLPEAIVSFDDAGSPWYTLCEVSATGTPGLLQALSVCAAAARIGIWSVQVSTSERVTHAYLELVNPSGGKLSDSSKQRLHDAVRDGCAIGPLPRPGRWIGARLQKRSLLGHLRRVRARTGEY